MSNQTIKRDYYKTNIGWLPIDWEVCKFSELAEFRNGLNYLQGEEGFKVKVVGVEDFQDRFTITYDEVGTVTLSNPLKEQDVLQEGDLLFVRSNGNRKLIGRVLLIKDINEPISHSGFTIRARLTTPNVLSEFVGLYLQTFTARKQIYILGGGTNISNLSQEILGYLDIPKPQIAEQRKICEVIQCWNISIETTEKLIAAKAELKKGLTQQLLTGKKRFSKFAVQDWKEVRLSEIFREVTDTNDGDEHHSIMTISSRLGLISQKEKFDRVIAGDSLKKYTQLKRGDFAYNKGNSKSYQMGCIYQLEDRESALVPFVYICFRPTDAICPEFYKHWFLAHGLDRQLKKIITSGARGDGLLNVNTDDFFKLKVPFPSKDEQATIAQVFQALDKELVLLQKKRDALKQQKRGLLQQLLTGKKRVEIDDQAGREAVAI